MMRGPHSNAPGGLTPQKVVMVICGVSMMMNVGFVLNQSIPGGAGGSEALKRCERNLADQTKVADNARSARAAVEKQLLDSRGGGGGGGEETEKKCPPCNCNEGSNAEQKEDEEGAVELGSSRKGNDPAYVWLAGRERCNKGVRKDKYKTDNTYYDPADDWKLQKQLKGDKGKYALSPVPMGSARIRIAPEKWITLDEFSFAHDVFFEEWQRFSFGNWLGVKCQQDPMDAFAIQDMLWRVKPDLIIEVGTNNGGGAIFYASIMSMYNPKGKIVTLDVKDVKQNWMTGPNKDNCPGCINGDEHPLWTNSDMINFVKGDITKREVQEKVEEFTKKAKTVLVVEDASHRYPDTLHRMNVIYKYVTVGSYMLVQDTKMDRFVGRLRKKYGGLKFGPMRAVDEFIQKHDNWEIDRTFEYYIYSQHHRGFLKKLSD